jgi:hypothetical protein
MFTHQIDSLAAQLHSTLRDPKAVSLDRLRTVGVCAFLSLLRSKRPCDPDFDHLLQTQMSQAMLLAVRTA